MPQDTETPQPITSVATDKQVVTGPDKKRYVFSKKISQDRINKYFTKKGWQLKDGKWLTASGESVEDLTKVGSPSPNTSGDILKKKQQLDKFGKLQTDVTLYGTAALPSILGTIGGLLGRTPGAAIGGGLGEGIKDVARNSVYDKKVGAGEYLKNIGEESLKQAALEKVGQKTGDIFFKQLEKLPHAITKKGIPLLPGDINPNSKLMKYVEDLLSNLAPSSKTMAGFRDKQNQAIITQTEKLANGFAKFNGTSEEMGVLLRNTLRAEQDMAEANLNAVRKSLPAGHQSLKYLKLTQEYKDYVANFDYELMRSIVRTNKPELIAGMLRTSRASLEETRQLTDFVHEINPEILGKVKNRIIRDVLNETLTGSKDPTIKASLSINKGFSGSKFKSILDGIGEEKLKALYGQKGYDSITKFESLISHVDKTQGGGAGKFLNLLFVLPFRSGMSASGTGKTLGLGLILNRAAKIITNPDGVKLYENYIRATTAQSPRLLSLTRDELITYNEKSDREYELEQQLTEEEFKKSSAKIESMSFGSEGWEHHILSNK